MRPQRRFTPSLAAAVALLLSALVAPQALARSHDVALVALPAEAQHTIKLIRQGGPFPYDRDGVVFGNREARLPAKTRGYYHEYTVPTPGARDRGARRIVRGAGGELYYTDDHYRTFRRVRE